jgi:enoyl-CoA hydratase
MYEAELISGFIEAEAGSGGIATVSLNRPAKLNAITHDMRHDLAKVFARLDVDDSVKAIVIRGLGKCFSVGSDLHDLRQTPKSDVLGASQRGRKTRPPWFEMIWDNDKPVIAQVHSYCLGAATEIASVCDLTICASDSVFGWPEIEPGGTPATIWPYLLGYKRSSALLHQYVKFGAPEAEQYGLVSQVVPPQDLEAAVSDAARRIAARPLSSIVFTKMSIHRAFEEMGIREALSASRQLNVLANADNFTPLSPEEADSEYEQR